MKKNITERILKQKSKENVDLWIENETAEQRKALKNAPKQFEANSPFTIDTLKAIYGQESL
jgi:hypothetical protein